MLFFSLFSTTLCGCVECRTVPYVGLQCMAFPVHTHVLFDRRRVSWYILEINSKSARLNYSIVGILQCCFVMRVCVALYTCHILY